MVSSTPLQSSVAWPAAPTEARISARVRALFEAHYALVWRTVRRFGVPAEDADDAAQEVFIVVARRCADIREGSERAFLVATALRVAAHDRRSRGRRPTTPRAPDTFEEVRDPAEGPDELAAQREHRALLDEALAALSPRLRAVFILFELEGMTMAAIAECLELSPGTVASRVRRGRERFREAVRELEERARRKVTP
jgi:RNA polymerase sigma-70 factor, ECF subfamily